jgi:hypothetical protein
MEKHEHIFRPFQYARDDSGFWLTCIKCGELVCFDYDTEEDFFYAFGLGDDD